MQINKLLNKNSYKNVNGLNVTSGGEYIDADIKKAMYAIIYYSIDSVAEVKSFFIPNTDMFGANLLYSRWFRDVSGTKTIYVRVWWGEGKISLSSSTTNVAEVEIKGYTLLMN